MISNESSINLNEFNGFSEKYLIYGFKIFSLNNNTYEEIKAINSTNGQWSIKGDTIINANDTIITIYHPYELTFDIQNLTINSTNISSFNIYHLAFTSSAN